MSIPEQTLFQSLITEATCGDACWHAREDICRCSCGGKNHGCLRTEDGEQPARTRKIKNMMYQLVAVSPSPDKCDCAHSAWEPIESLNKAVLHKAIETGLCTYGDINYADGYRMENFPCYVKTATDGEITRWAEFSAWRNSGKWFKPVALWVRMDMLQLVK